MKLKLDNPKIFSEVVGIISEMVLEVRIKVNKEGLNITAIDPANVAMILFKLPADAFSELEVEKEEVLGVSLDNLKAVLRRVKAGSVLSMEREENMLKIIVQDKIRKEFSLALIDVEGDEKPIPSLNFTSKIEMTSLDFSEAIEDCAVVADSCSFVSAPDSFGIQGKGNLNSFKSEFTDEVNITAEEAASKYSLEYLQKMVKGTKLTDKVVLNFGNDYPLKLEFNTPKVNLSFILAPRVETED
tara:strand:- start:599 stop:1327 length:729 start_codon:yes stop_codon:yes gene_type:complete